MQDYPLGKEEAVRFHVFLSDREILRKLTMVLEGKGYVGYWDHSGQMSYVLDGRKGVESTVKRMQEIYDHFEDEQRGASSPNSKLIKQAILDYLYSRGFSPENKGTVFLYEIIYYLLKPGADSSNLRKGVYQTVAGRHHTTVELVDRSIRYAKARAGIGGGNRSLIHSCLRDLEAHAHPKAGPCKNLGQTKNSPFTDCEKIGML